ncbi:MAG: DUF401 family protein, partial [Caldisericaceae bacterium]|nr:DUF401 family protein [Caldisericaceae bacterium]
MKDIIVLFAALATLGILVKLKVNIGISIFASALVVLLSSKAGLLKVPKSLLNTAINKETIYLILIVVTITYFADLLKVSGFLEDMVKSFSSFFSVKIFVPLFAFIIGALPMPGGALVSAPLVEKGSEYSTLNNAEKTVINFWFRHIWEPTSPLYPEMILASSIIGVPILKIVEIQWIYSFLMFLSGVIFLLPLIKVKRTVKINRSSENLKHVLTSTMPITLVILLILLFKLPVVTSGIIGIAYIVIVKKLKPSHLRKALNSKLLLKLVVLMYSIMFLKTVVKNTGVISGVYAYMNSIHIPYVIILFFLPFVVSLMSGAASATIGV